MNKPFMDIFSPDNARRFDDVTIAKAIGILLMVLAHTRFSKYGDTLINMFHMPLFFFFSGYCIKDKYFSNFKEFTTRRIKGLWWPFVKWNLLFLALHNLFYRLNIYSDTFGHDGRGSHIYDTSEIVERSLHIIGNMTCYEQLLGGFWFLHTLFFSSFIAYVVILLTSKFKINSGWGGVILLSISVIMRYTDVYIPGGIHSRELQASAIIVSGYVYRRSVLSKMLELKNNFRSIFLMIGCALVVVGSIFWSGNLLQIEWYNIFPYTISAIAGVIVCFIISQRINSVPGCIRNMLVYIGDNTMAVLTWHMLSFKIVSLLIVSIYSLPAKQLAEFPVVTMYSEQGWFFLYFCVGVIVPLGIACLAQQIKILCQKYQL